MIDINLNELVMHLDDLEKFVECDRIFKIYQNHVKEVLDYFVNIKSSNGVFESKYLNGLTLLLSDILYTAELKQKFSLSVEKSDYSVYMDIQTSLMDLNDILIFITKDVKEYCSEKAIMRDYPSMIILGLLYEYGLGVEKAQEKSLRYYEQAALKQYTVGQHILSTYYYKHEEFDKAQYWASKANTGGLKQSNAILGKSCYYGPNRDSNYAKIVELLESEYVNKDEEVSEILIECYFFGRGVAINYDKVISLYHNFSEKESDKIICYRLGVAYANAEINKDYQASKRWYKLAADLKFLPAVKELIKVTDGYERLNYKYLAASLGDIPSIKAVVEACENGELPNADLNAVMAWYEKIAKDGDEEVGLHIANLYATGKIIPQNQYRAFIWFLKVAEWGNVDAELAVAHRLKNGIGTQVNENEAYKWYQKAAVGGNQDAQGVIGKLCYEAGEYNSAFSYLAAAASANDDEINYLLAECYLNGLGTQKDDNKAFYYYQIAATYGNADAQCKVGVFYDNATDYSTALQWYTASLQNGCVDARLRIAMLYYQGNGVPQNVNYAVKEISDLAYSDHLVAQLWLGYFYENGIVVEKDNYIAALWYIKAAKAGSMDAVEYARSLKNKLQKLDVQSGAYRFNSLKNATKNIKALKALLELSL